ncbi:MAG: hypothetical protein K1X61_15130 [Chitinophagales bacterium]|nr:hypothetical protein [Chitinophagales bacterium]
MAINKNHEFEDLEGVKCAIVEKNAAPARISFLKDLLAFNGYAVVVVKSPPPKAAAAKPAAATDVPVTAANSGEALPTQPSPPETYTIGVTDVMFNATNAVFGRSLKTESGHIVTLAYWLQQEKQPHDEIPYFENKAG